MKILLLITGLGMGGAERVVADLADALASAGHEVALVCMKGPLQVRPRSAQVRVSCLEMNSAWSRVSGFFRFRSLLRSFRPDIVHGHMFHAAILARLARLTTPVPCVVCTMHTAYDGGRWRAWVYRCSDRLCDISTNVSEEAVAAFAANGAVSRERMIAIHNGIAVDAFRPSDTARSVVRERHGIAPDCKLFLAVGRLDWSKDYPNMFRALARLPDTLRFRLLIAGDGPLRPELERLVAELGLGSRIEFLGIRRDVAELMAAADVFVLSSVGEAFALVVAEAMACECVVVATDSGGVREVLGDAGYLVPSRDPARLADALLAASTLSAADAAALGRAARQRVVQTYSFEGALEKWQALYAGLLSRRKREAFD
jgi:glycosyltransferase involved in cell wall biosynthesis